MTNVSSTQFKLVSFYIHFISQSIESVYTWKDSYVCIICIYDRFIQANKEASEQLIPKKKGKQRPNVARDDQIQKARGQLQTAHDCYVNSPTSIKSVKNKKAKENLVNCYDKAIEENLQNKVGEIERACNQQQYSLSMEINKWSKR